MITYLTLVFKWWTEPREKLPLNLTVFFFFDESDPHFIETQLNKLQDNLKVF